MAFDRDRFVEDCVRSLGETDARAAIMDHLARAVSDHAAVLAGMGEPTEAGLDVLLRSPELTIFAAKWAPNMTLSPHNHLMWAMIGIYTGREDNMFWRRSAHAPRGLVAGGARAMFAGDVCEMPEDAIHSVTNPLGRFTLRHRAQLVERRDTRRGAFQRRGRARDVRGREREAAALATPRDPRRRCGRCQRDHCCGRLRGC